MVEPWRKEKKNFFLPSLCSSVFHLLFFYDRWIVRTIICKLIVERNSWSRFFERWFKHSISIFSLLLNYHDCIYKYVDKFREPGEWALNSQNFTLSLSLSSRSLIPVDIRRKLEFPALSLTRFQCPVIKPCQRDWGPLRMHFTNFTCVNQVIIAFR